MRTILLGFLLFVLFCGSALAITSEARVLIVKEFRFQKADGKIGINTFALPFKPPKEVATIGKFINQVNETAGDGVVAGFGYYDNDQQKLFGIMIRPEDYQGVVIDESGIMTYGDIQARDFLRRKMVMDQPYQLTVLYPVNLRLSGER
jgi:hypothetical protein